MARDINEVPDLSWSDEDLIQYAHRFNNHMGYNDEIVCIPQIAVVDLKKLIVARCGP